METSFCVKRNPIVTKIFLSILVPTIFMNLTTAIGSMADAVIIGQYLDELSLSVVTYATPIYMLINTIAALFAVGGCIAMSVDIGKGDKLSANRSFSIAIELLAFFSIVLFLAGVFFTAPITKWLGAGGAEVFDLVKVYVRIILMGAPIFIMNIAIAFFVRNDGRPTLSMVGMLTSIVVDIIFNLVFVGFMDMGVAGAAYSTVLGQGVGIAIISSHFFSSKNTLKFVFALDRSVFRIIKNGIGTALTFVYQFVTIIILNHFVVSMAGANGVVIYTVVFNLCTVSLAVFEGLSQTIQPMVSVYYGENSNKKIKQSVKLAILYAIIICGSVMVFLEIFPGIVPYIFGIADSALIEQASSAVRIYSISMLIMTINVIVGYYLQSVEQGTMASVLISLRCCILFLLSAFVLGKLFGMNGIWAAYVVAEVITFIIFLGINKAKRRSIAMSGIAADFFFLDKEEEQNTTSLVWNGKISSAEKYNSTVENVLKNANVFDECVVNAVKDYLSDFAGDNGKYVEVEINNRRKKIIIRDNYDHTLLKQKTSELNYEGVEAEYGPVLGWNRICLKGVESDA